MPKDKPLATADKDLFRAAVQGTRPLSQDKVRPPRPAAKSRPAEPQQVVRQQQAEDPFSDTYEPALPTSGPMRYTAPGAPDDLTRRLRRGHYTPELVVDLHGLTQAQARQELAAAITAARRELVACLNIIHGVGHGILKSRTPLWLAQHHHVRAFHAAPLEWGGHGALLVLIALPDR